MLYTYQIELLHLFYTIQNAIEAVMFLKSLIAFLNGQFAYFKFTKYAFKDLRQLDQIEVIVSCPQLYLCKIVINVREIHRKYQILL